MVDCYICKALKEKGRYEYSRNYTTLAIEKGSNGRYRCFAWGEGSTSVDCNFCPHCGRQLEETLESYSFRDLYDMALTRKHWNLLRIELEKRKFERKFANDVERFTAYDSILDYMDKLEEGVEDED